MKTPFRSFFPLFIYAVLALACTPITPDLTLAETGSWGSASVEVNRSSSSNISLVFPASGGSATVAIKPTWNWEATVTGSHGIDWCKFSPSSGGAADTQFDISVSETPYMKGYKVTD